MEYDAQASTPEQWSQFSECVVLLKPDETAAAAYAEIKMHLESRGKRTPDNDMWLAATAKSFDLPLYCRDGHFDELAGIMTVVQGPKK